MNTASRLDINWPHPWGNCVSMSHITVVTPGCHNVTTVGSVITEYGSSATATPWLRREPRTDLWTELVLRDAAACGVYTALYTRTVVTVHLYTLYRQHMWSQAALSCTVYTTNNTRLVTLRFTDWLGFSLRLHASDNDDHWAIKRKSHTGFTFLWRQ